MVDEPLFGENHHELKFATSSKLGETNVNAVNVVRSHEAAHADLSRDRRRPMREANACHRSRKTRA